MGSQVKIIAVFDENDDSCSLFERFSSFGGPRVGSRTVKPVKSLESELLSVGPVLEVHSHFYLKRQNLVFMFEGIKVRPRSRMMRLWNPAIAGHVFADMI